MPTAAEMTAAHRHVGTTKFSHRDGSSYVEYPKCGCGVRMDPQQHAQHLADALAEAGHLTFNPQWEMTAPGSFTLPEDCIHCHHAAHNGLCLVLTQPPTIGRARCACTAIAKATRTAATQPQPTDDPPHPNDVDYPLLVAEIRALHRQADGGFACSQCIAQDYPCATVRALDEAGCL